MNKYWFKQKSNGYGVTPISVEGWGVTLLLIVIITALVILQGEIIKTHVIGLMIVLLEIGIITISFLKLMKNRTREKSK